MPPMPTSRSEAAPRAGLAVMPEKPSEPPHCSARRSSEAGTGSRVARFTSGKQRVDLVDDHRHGLGGAAGLLDGQAVEAVGEVGAEARLHPPDLHHLAAEADEDRGADVRVGGVAPEHALQVVEARPLGRHAAAGAVGEGDDAVDVRIVGEDAGAHHLLGGAADHRRRAVHRGADRDHVAGADLAVGAAVALEARGLDLRDRGAGRRRGRRRRGSPGRGRRRRSCGNGRARRPRSAGWRSR